MFSVGTKVRCVDNRFTNLSTEDTYVVTNVDRPRSGNTYVDLRYPSGKVGGGWRVSRFVEDKLTSEERILKDYTIE